MSESRYTISGIQRVENSLGHNFIILQTRRWQMESK